MVKQIDVKLPVRNLEGSKAFFASLGFGFNPQFTTDDAACMVIGENIFVMLLVEKFFKTFTQKEICEAMRSTAVLVCVSCDSRAEVDELVAKAKAAGGTIPGEPRTMGSWMAMPLKIWMATSGSSSPSRRAHRVKARAQQLLSTCVRTSAWSATRPTAARLRRGVRPLACGVALCTILPIESCPSIILGVLVRGHGGSIMDEQQESGPQERLRAHPSGRFVGESHAFNLGEVLCQLRAEAHPAERGHRQMTILHRAPVTQVIFAFEPGGELAEHAAHGLVTIHVLEGRLAVHAGERDHELRAGSILVLNPDVRHHVRALEASAMLLTVHLEGET